MQIIFLVNNPCDIQPSQTTALLIATAVARGHRVGITGVGDLSYRSDSQPWAQVRLVASIAGSQSMDSDALTRLMGAIAQTPATAMPLTQTDLLLLRTNPARDLNHAAVHTTAIDIARRCQSVGVRVVNQPDGLLRAATKLYLLELPEFIRPETLVSQNPAEILDFLQNLNGPAVLKPLQGTRGTDVFLVASHQDHNLHQIIEVIRRQGLIMAQRYIPGAEAGDTRVVVFNGKVLTLNGQPAAIRRVPAQGDFRSNIHAGGRAEPGIVTAAMDKVVAVIGPKLLQDGLFLTGLDFIGSQLVEINVFSTGGLRNAEQFTGEAFASCIIDTLTGRHFPSELGGKNC